jgi:hypothetical protein
VDFSKYSSKIRVPERIIISWPDEQVLVPLEDSTPCSQLQLILNTVYRVEILL